MRNIIFLLSLLISNAALAASFDCTKAKSPQEKAICASPELNAADEKLAGAYKAALITAATEKKEAVRDGQRVWLRAVKESCSIPGLEPSVALPECLLGYYQTRIQELSLLSGTRHDEFITRFIMLTWPDKPGEGSGSEEIPGYGTMKATWPQSTSNTAEWQAWNKAIEAATQTLASMGRDVSSTGGWLAKWAADGDFEVNASVGLVSEDLVTASVGIGGMGHGAGHPSEDGFEFNWLRKQKRELRPEDIFRKESQWEKAIVARCSKELQETSADGLYEDWEKALPKVVLNSRNWQLTGGGLTIDFPEYSVAPRVAPVAPVKIPWKSLKPFLQPGFAIPKKKADAPS